MVKGSYRRTGANLKAAAGKLKTRPDGFKQSYFPQFWLMQSGFVQYLNFASNKLFIIPFLRKFIICPPIQRQKLYKFVTLLPTRQDGFQN